MKPLAVALFAFLAFAIGCGGDGDDGQSSTVTPPASTTPAGTSPPETTTSPGATTTDPAERDETTSPGTTKQEKVPSKGQEQPRETGSTPDSRRVERYLRDNFGGAGAEPEAVWYRQVVEIVVSGSTTTIRTALSDNRAGKKLARQICLDARGSIPGVTDTVRVTALSGSALAKCVP